MTLIYKILPRDDWSAACAVGAYTGSVDDIRDGFIHLSPADQVEGTARKYFHGQPDLLLAVFEAESLGERLVWEPSRGGALFPHLYGPLPLDAVRSVVPLPLGGDGHHVFPDRV